MDEIPIAGDIASKVGGSARSGRLLLPDHTRIKSQNLLVPIETDLRTTFAAHFPNEPMWKPPAVSENMRSIAKFINGNQFILLLLLKNMDKLDFSTILMQHFYVTRKEIPDDPFPDGVDTRKSYVVWHVLENILKPENPKIALFRNRNELEDKGRIKTFDLVNTEFNFNQPVIQRNTSAQVTKDGSTEAAKQIMDATAEATKVAIMHFDWFVEEHPSSIGYIEAGVNGMVSFFEKRIIPAINELIEKTNQPAEIFPDKLAVATNEIVHRFDRQLKSEGLQGMVFEDIYSLNTEQRNYFVVAVSKYLIYMKISTQPNFRTLQFDSANKDPSIAVAFATAYHFQNWKGGKMNKLTYL